MTFPLTSLAGLALLLVTPPALAAPTGAPPAAPHGPLWWLESWWAQLGFGAAIVGALMLFMRLRARRQKRYS